MTTFMDGPAKGKTLMLSRAPHYLRVVIDKAGKVDALDQLTDVPRDDETIVVYEMVGEPTWVHVCRSPRSQSGMYRGGRYRVVAEQPDDATLRLTTQWRAWVAGKVGQPLAADGGIEQPVEQKG